MWWVVLLLEVHQEVKSLLGLFPNSGVRTISRSSFKTMEVATSIAITLKITSSFVSLNVQIKTPYMLLISVCKLLLKY